MTKEKAIKILQKTWKELISSPNGDPIEDTLCPATNIIKALIELGETKFDQDYLEILRGCNVCPESDKRPGIPQGSGRNFIRGLGFPNWDMPKDYE